MSTPDPKPSIGRIVHYVIPSTDGWKLPGKHRPAIIVEVFTEGDQNKMGAVALQVFTDGPRDLDAEPGETPYLIWRMFVLYDETGQQEHSWHWPERV